MFGKSSLQFPDVILICLMVPRWLMIYRSFYHFKRVILVSSTSITMPPKTGGKTKGSGGAGASSETRTAMTRSQKAGLQVTL